MSSSNPNNPSAQAAITAVAAPRQLRDYPNPQIAVFLRILAWECFIAGKRPTVKDVVTKHVQSARTELGLGLYGDRSGSGAADDFVQKLRDRDLLSIRTVHRALKEVLPGEPFWKDEWRLLYLPPHSLVRRLSADPVEKGGVQSTLYEGLITLRDPAIPRLRVLLGSGIAIAQASANRRGVYFAREVRGLYIGLSEEFDVRARSHLRNKNPRWCVFISPEEVEQTFTLDSLRAAEGLLISFWNEIIDVTNRNRGATRKPSFSFLQESIIFVTGASAAFLWLMRQQNIADAVGIDSDDWDAAFKKWPRRGTDWPACYLKTPDA